MAALLVLLLAHAGVTCARYVPWLAKLTDHRVRVLAEGGHVRRRQLLVCGLTEGDLYARLRQQGVYDLTGLRYVLYETKGELTVVQEVMDTPPAPTGWLTGQPLTYDITHSDELFFLGLRQHEQFLLDGAPHVAPGAPVRPAIRNFMDDQGRAYITHSDPQAWAPPQELQAISWLADHRIASS